MSLTDVLAAYAALVATIAFGWNVYVWVKERRSQILVSLRREVDTRGAVGLRLRVVNRSGHIVRIQRITLWSVRPLLSLGPFEPTTKSFEPSRLQEAMSTVPPKESREALMSPTFLRSLGFMDTARARALIHLSTDETYSSTWSAFKDTVFRLLNR
jgi:hypothetical protein